MDSVALWYQKYGYAKELADVINNSKYDYNAKALPERPEKALQHLFAKDFDIVQTDELLRFGTIAAANKQLRGTSFTVHAQGWGDYLNSHGEHNFIERISVRRMVQYCLKNIDGLLLITRETKRKLQRHFELPMWKYGKPVFDVKRYANATPEKNVGEIRLLSVTNLRYEKKLDGIKLILEALKGIFPSQEITYRIAGGGEYLSELSDFVTAYDYSDNVEVLGYRDDIPQLLADADIFVYASFLDSLAMTVLEAQAAGLPVIASDTGGIPEAVGEAGIVCAPESSEIENSIRTLVQNPAIRKEYSKQSRERVKNYRQRQGLQNVELWESIRR
jgi:glycosyltransferase involved in cell wall biosynthesis